jgi:hypothetical protein
VCASVPSSPTLSLCPRKDWILGSLPCWPGQPVASGTGPAGRLMSHPSTHPPTYLPTYPIELSNLPGGSWCTQW